MLSVYLVDTTSPDELPGPGLVLEVDVAELRVTRVDRHPAHLRVRPRLVVVGAPVIRAIVVPGISPH